MATYAVKIKPFYDQPLVLFIEAESDMDAVHAAEMLPERRIRKAIEDQELELVWEAVSAEEEK